MWISSPMQVSSVAGYNESAIGMTDSGVQGRTPRVTLQIISVDHEGCGDLMRTVVGGFHWRFRRQRHFKPGMTSHQA